MNPLFTFTKIAAFLSLLLMFILMFFSSGNDAATFDESAHIGAGYSYITQKDMRLNPEHPPLMKDLAGIALLPLAPSYRTDTEAWRNGVNEQWLQGSAFLHEWGNDADQILRFSRIPTMILALIIGGWFFIWTQRRFGNAVALAGTFLYAFSPTIIAHSRLVTTDTAATFGFFLGITTFLSFLKNPNLRHVFAAGAAFGIAQSLKFSLFLLVPIYLALVFIWWMVERKSFRDLLILLAKITIIFLIGLGIIWLIYTWHIWNYPQDKQLSDAETLVGGFKMPFFASLDHWLIEHKITRPLGHYLTGLLMVTQRTAGGNTAYFLGEVSSKGWLHYFPTAYLIKEPLGIHLLMLLVICLALYDIVRSKNKSFDGLKNWIRDNFIIFASLFAVFFYWTYSMLNPLNIGVRHMMPTLPFIYFLISWKIIGWISGPKAPEMKTLKDRVMYLYHNVAKPIPRIIIIFFIFLWIASSTLAAFPYYISYFNEIGGGTQSGYKYITDSNYDWGQDLKRLRDLLNTDYTGEKIYLSYFGGSQPRYYLGERYIDWWSERGSPPSGSLFAISINTLQGDHFARREGDAALPEEKTWPWLRGLRPIGRGGTSIFIYRIP